MLLLALASSGFVLQSLSFALPTLVRAWRVDAPAFSAAFTLHLLGITAGALAFGRLGDLAGRKRVLLWAIALQGIATLACVTCSSTTPLAILRLLAGIGLGGIAANAVALAVTLAPDRGNSLWTTLVVSGVAIGSSLPGLAQQWSAAVPGGSLLFWLGGAGSLLLLPVIALVLPDSPASPRGGTRSRSTPGAFRTLLASGRVLPTLALWAAYAGSMLAMHLITSWLPLLLETAGHSATRAATFTGWIHLAGVGAVLVSAPAFARLGLRWLAALLLIAFGSAALLALQGLRADGLGLLVVGLGFGLVGSQSVLGTFAAHLYPDACRSTGVGAALAAGRLGSMLGPLAGGAIQSAGYPARGMFVLPLCAITLALLATWALAVQAPAGRHYSGGS